MTARPEILPSGRYRGTTWDANARRKGPSRTFARESEAYAWAQATEREMDHAIRGHGIEVRRSAEPLTFAEYAAGWTRSGPPSTRRAAASSARALAAHWPTEKIGDITTTMVKAMLHDMEERGLTPSTRTGRLTILRRIMTDAIVDGLRSDDPTAGVKGPRSQKDAGKHRFITEGELTRIMAGLPVWLHAAVLLSRDSGLRIAEVCGLPWHRLDLLHGRVTVSDVVLADGTVRGTRRVAASTRWR